MPPHLSEEEPYEEEKQYKRAVCRQQGQHSGCPRVGQNSGHRVGGLTHRCACDYVRADPDNRYVVGRLRLHRYRLLLEGHRRRDRCPLVGQSTGRWVGGRHRRLWPVRYLGGCHRRPDPWWERARAWRTWDLVCPRVDSCFLWYPHRLLLGGHWWRDRRPRGFGNAGRCDRECGWGTQSVQPGVRVRWLGLRLLLVAHLAAHSPPVVVQRHP